ncbi:MAG: metal-dependent transcriptional regulator [Eubacteriales bacterium]|nr:metal-dependent transcriptional regulator [Eubacteriales bacterium]MDY3332341.1 metal-dependent transcriptional regulator [Gallibacter sp.]
MTLKESGENYLEAILVLSKSGRSIRAIDIVNYFGYARPTVSVALKQLKAEGYVNVDDRNFITLSPKGKRIANSIYDKHESMAKILLSLGVDEKTAYKDACRLEHVLSNKSFKAIKEHFNLK